MVPLYMSASEAHSHTHPEADRHALQVRVRKVGGQLRAIEEMLEEDRDCAEILTQLVSARRGLKSLAEKLMAMHMHHCIDHADSPTEAKRKLRELLTVLERYVE